MLRNLKDSNLVVMQQVTQKIRFVAVEISNCYFSKFTVSDVLGIAWNELPVWKTGAASSARQHPTPEAGKLKTSSIF